MADFRKGDKVFIRDYPFGKPLRLYGTVVGILSDEYYNVKLESGLCTGDIKRYKYWKLCSESFYDSR